MQKIIFIFFISILKLSAQSYLNKNWVWFNESNSQLYSNRVIKILEDKNNNYWISSGGVLQRYHNGIWNTFDSTNSPLNKIWIADIAETSGGKLLFGTDNNGLYIKDGNNWDSLNTSNSPLPDNFIFKVTVDKLNRYWLGIPNYGIAVFDNGNWTLYNYQNSFDGIDDFNFIVVDSLNKIWIGTDFFGLYCFDGSIWTKKLERQDTTGQRLLYTSLTIDTLNQKWATIIDQGGGNKIAKIINDTSIVFYDSINYSSSFTFFSYDGALVDKENVKYFGTTEGLLRSDNINWTYINSSNSPVPYNWFNKGIIDSRNNKIYTLESFAPSQNYGLIFYNEDSVVVTSINENIFEVNSYTLYQNYPNPFNPNTVISYQLPVTSKVTIKLFDMLGREIETLIDEEKPAGQYSTNFNAGNLSSGVYFYSIIANDFHQTKKMVLIR